MVFFGVLLHFTPFGRGLYAMGYSKEAASFVGDQRRPQQVLAVRRVRRRLGARRNLLDPALHSARSDNASGLELAVIAAVLLGGVSIFGGKGSIPGVIAGVLLIGTLNYALRLARVSDVVLITVTGLLLIVSVVAPSIGSAIRQWRHTRRVRRSFTRKAT